MFNIIFNVHLARTNVNTIILVTSDDEEMFAELKALNIMQTYCNKKAS